jgi:murein DD-endopeptidase MepM/ murein hydrolase activator NlpD
VVALHEGRPFVTSSGIVELWHRGCWADRDEPITIVVAPTAPTAPTIAPAIANVDASERAPRLTVGVLAGLALAGAGFAHWTWERVDPPPPSSLANVDLRPVEAVDLHATMPSRDAEPPAETALAARFPIPKLNGERLDDVFTSLRGWIHPVTSTSELMPPLVTRLFGAVRGGTERRECGRGHCGVDLDGPVGRPLVAVAAGTVVRVERSALGSDGKSGRYVRLQHDDGTLTSYMHMDQVADGLQLGDRVEGGQYIGTLGATAIYNATPHLHFSLELPLDHSERGDHTATRYADPAPFLVRASVIATPERRKAIKPAF